MAWQNDSLSWRELRPDLAELASGSPLLQQALTMWTARCHDGLIPGRRDFAAEELMRLRGSISLIDVEDEPRRYRFRLIGARIAERLGRDSTGRYLDELYSAETYDLAVAGYEACVRDRTPVGAQGRMVHANKDFVPFTAIDFPLASDGRRVDMIMKCADL